MPDLVPVDHDPFSDFTPVDHDPFVPRQMVMPNPPVIGNRPDVQAAVKSFGASLLEPFGQLGRVITGQSQDWPTDLAGAAVGLAPIGPPGAGRALKAGAEAAEGALAKGLKVADDGLRINIAPHNMEVPEWGKGLSWGLTAYRTKVKGEDAIHIRDARLPPDMQGQGLGTAMYEHAATLAAKEGKPLLSDGSVTEDAANRWMALNRLGHNVVLNPEARFTKGPPEAPQLGRFQTPDGAPVFRVEPSRNFVVFDDRLIDILKKYGIAGIGALPAMNGFHFQTQPVDHDPFP